MFLCILALYFVVVVLCIIFIPRYCPKCKRRMRRLSPRFYDTKHSYKQYCGYCRLYIDTKIYNSYD
jgi:hypothetical protein